jgi:hypothetical protein
MNKVYSWKKKDYVGIAKNMHNSYFKIGIWTHARWWDKLGVRLTLSFFIIFISDILQNAKQNTEPCIKNK